ncbi:MAG: recombinase RecA [Ruminococcus flavefaciens]|nr:recombinase RecA [Ruminococcus flavefaciens]MCM1060722.1 recombinase RecA [Eubacterium sp.]
MAKKELAKKPAVVQATTKEDKKAALDGALKQIEKKYGAGAVMRLGQSKTLNVDAIPTGSMTLDMALGIGGVPRGRIVEIYGPESSGKTTVALSIIAQAQKMDGEVAFIDVEHALDPVYAQALGVNIENLLVSQPDSGEQALEIAEALIRSGAIDVIVLDSIAAMTTRAEIDGEMGDLHVGQLARLMSQAMRKLTAAISKSNCVAIFINQIREKIGVMYGNPETTPGGRALKFYSSVRIEVRKGEVIKSGNEIIGASTKCKVVKNKVAPPFKECQFDMMYGQGISRTGEVLDLAVDLEIVKKGGSWFSYKDQKLGQGRDNVKEVLKNDEALMKEIEEQILARKDELQAIAPKKEKKGKKSGKKSEGEFEEEFSDDYSDSSETSEENGASMDSSDILADIEEDFEEFTPVEE